MKYKWLSKNESDKLIIFFSGWGTDDLIVSHLDCENYDVVILYDYNELSFDIDLTSYKEKHVVAWSMGVMIATLFSFDGIKSKTAVCGTPYTVDDNFGIPEKIYTLTLKTFSDESVRKFMKRMFLSDSVPEKFSNRNTENLKQELIKMAEYKPNKEYKYTKVIIGEGDLIIPVKNQKRYWGAELNIKYVNSGHCPFGLYKSWSELIG